jgi:hypothetical protein
MFDNLEENTTGIGERMFHRLFHKNIDFGNAVPYNEFVITLPRSIQDTATHQHHFSKAPGCCGAIGSMDALHVTLWRNCR